MNEKDIQEVAQELTRLEIIPSATTYENLVSTLTTKINDLINNNFSGLIQLLYRLDISENKLKALLKNNSSNAASIIAELIIERQLEKINTRKSFRKEDNISEDEKW